MIGSCLNYLNDINYYFSQNNDRSAISQLCTAVALMMRAPHLSCVIILIFKINSGLANECCLKMVTFLTPSLQKPLLVFVEVCVYIYASNEGVYISLAQGHHEKN